MNMSRKSGLPFSLVALFIVLILAGCRGRQAGVKTNLGTKAGEQSFSKFQPDNPYAQLAPGILTRTVFAGL